MTLREFLQAWATKDGEAMEALLTDDRRQHANFADPAFFDTLDRLKFGATVAVPEGIDSYVTSGRGANQGIDRDDVRCFSAPLTFYYDPGVVGPNDSGEELPWLWWLVRGPDGERRVDSWGA